MDVCLAYPFIVSVEDYVLTTFNLTNASKKKKTATATTTKTKTGRASFID
jgi:hypothetical protein